MGRARIQATVGDHDVSIAIERDEDEIRVTGGTAIIRANPYGPLVTAIQSTAAALGLPIADLAAMLTDENAS